MPAPERSGLAPPARHTLVWLRADWRAALRAPLAQADADAIARWQRRGLPLIAARRCATDAVDTLRLGLALPGRRRIGVALAAAARECETPPPPLAAALASAPPDWRAPLAGLAALAADTGTDCRVYGSLAWQHLSGDAYLTTGSDVDLLFAPTDRTGLERLLLALGGSDGYRPAPRLDGELRLPDGADLAWRELLALPPKLLAKTATGVGWRSLASVFGAWAAVAPAEPAASAPRTG